MVAHITVPHVQCLVCFYLNLNSDSKLCNIEHVWDKSGNVPLYKH